MDMINIPCLVCNCNTLVFDTADNQSSDDKEIILFLLRQLLKIPKPLLNGDESNENNGQCSRFLVTCEQCKETVKQASVIYSEIRELARKFRGIQREIVETLKKCGATDVLIDDINYYRKLVKDYDYNGFGFPFVVHDEQELDPEEEQVSSATELVEVTIKQEDTGNGNQEILLLFPEEYEEHDEEVKVSKMDLEEEGDSDYQLNELHSDSEEDYYQDSPGNSEEQQEKDDDFDDHDSEIGSGKEDQRVGEARNEEESYSKSANPAPELNLLSSFICKKCLQRFRTKEELDQHDSSIHFKEEKGSFPCPLEGCFRMYTCSTKIPQHFRLHHRKPPFICKDCKQEFTNPREVSIHHKKIHSSPSQQQPIKPEITNHPRKSKSLPEKSTKVSKLRPRKPRPRKSKEIRNPNNPFPCPLCHHSLKKFSSLRKHLKSSHPDNKIPLHELRLKYFSPSTQPALPEVRKLTHPKHKFLGISTFELEYPHIVCKRNSQGKFPCPWAEPSPCPKVYAAKEALHRHIKVSHFKVPLYTCTWSLGEGEGAPVCGKTFATRHNYFAHYDMHRGTPGYKCEDCGMTFYRRNPFTRHKQRMHLNETFICELCGKSFSCKDHLYMHRIQRHREKSKEEAAVNKKDGDSGVICDLCGQILKNKMTLRAHVLVKHDKVQVPQNYCCHLCDKRFRASTYLNVHLWERHQLKVEGFQPKEKVDRKDKFQCPVKGCKKLFLKKENFDRHGIEVHGEDGNKPGPWNCKYCGKNFFWKEKWEQCERVHENMESRPEKCEVCGKGFPTKDYLKYHLRHTHKMQLENRRGCGRGNKMKK